ncbi:MAG: dockerin type I repeat-containing protein, partial [Clostridia bacterium]|nr:dockerin type I repeat-containing protein [Clostridia bacterium]
GTLIGSYNTAVYGKAIRQESGTLEINGGELLAENALAPLFFARSHSAVTVAGGTTRIRGGTFRTDNAIETIDKAYGLEFMEGAVADLAGGTFYGILLPSSSTPLSDFLDESLYTPLSDESWFNPTSGYSQGYTESGKVVRVVWRIASVELSVNEPRSGVEVYANFIGLATSGCEISLNYPQWYKNGEYVTDGSFEAGASYRMVIRLQTKRAYSAEFASGVTAVVNGKSVTASAPQGMSAKEFLEISCDFGACPATVGQIEMNVTAPKENAAISYSVTESDPAFSVMGSASKPAGYRAWLESTDGANFTEMTAGQKFVAGRYYKFTCWVKTAGGYSFPVYDDGSSIVPDVTALVNGMFANERKAYDQDPDEVIEVEMNFGMLSESLIKRIDVINITPPAPGEHPHYVATSLGTGYRLNEDVKRDYTTDAIYRQNGVIWYDEDWNIVLETDTFTAGRNYWVVLVLDVTDTEQYQFWRDNDGNALSTGTVNGNEATVIAETSNGMWHHRMQYLFPYQPVTVSEIAIGLDAPVAGRTPDLTMTLGETLYQPKENWGLDGSGIEWYRSDGTEMTADETFLEGEVYRVRIRIESAKLGEVKLCTFSTKATAAINGAEVKKTAAGWDEVSAIASRVEVWYTFPAALDPNAGAPVFGTVTSAGSANEAVTVRLYPSGMPEAAYEAVIYGRKADYFFGSVAAGNYTLSVTKKDHAASAQEITVGTEALQINVTLESTLQYLLGDLNEDGAVDSADAIYLLYNTLFGEARYPVNQPVDFNSDAKVDSADAIYLLYHTLFGEARYPLA